LCGANKPVKIRNAWTVFLFGRPEPMGHHQNNNKPGLDPTPGKYALSLVEPLLFIHKLFFEAQVFSGKPNSPVTKKRFKMTETPLFRYAWIG
ncbi:MAG: hypothetical protein AAF086_09130, partial [Planctomycetota bacterium]